MRYAYNIVAGLVVSSYSLLVGFDTYLSWNAIALFPCRSSMPRKTFASSSLTGSILSYPRIDTVLHRPPSPTRASLRLSLVTSEHAYNLMMRSTTSCPSSSVAAAVCPWGIGYGLEGANTDGWGRCCTGSCQRRWSPLIRNKGGGDGGIGWRKYALEAIIKLLFIFPYIIINVYYSC